RLAEGCNEPARGAAPSLDFGVEVIVAEARTEREPLQRPHILGVDPEVGVHVLVISRGGVVDRYGIGGLNPCGVRDVVLDDIARSQLRVAVYAERPLRAGLQRVRSR